MWLLLVVCAALIWYFNKHRPTNIHDQIALGFSILVTGLIGLNSINLSVVFILAVIGFGIYILLKMDKKKPPTIG